MSSKKSDEAMQLLTEVSENGTAVFVEQIQELNRLYNQQMKLMFNKNNILLIPESA